MPNSLLSQTNTIRKSARTKTGGSEVLFLNHWRTCCAVTTDSLAVTMAVVTNGYSSHSKQFLRSLKVCIKSYSEEFVLILEYFPAV